MRNTGGPSRRRPAVDLGAYAASFRGPLFGHEGQPLCLSRMSSTPIFDSSLSQALTALGYDDRPAMAEAKRALALSIAAGLAETDWTATADRSLLAFFPTTSNTA
jgi:hypothetical protein